VIDKVTISCSAQGVKNCWAKLEELRSLLATAKAQAHDRGDYELAVYTLHMAECKTAQVQGILDAIGGWLSPIGEGDNL